jgi:hypothetical protein
MADLKLFADIVPDFSSLKKGMKGQNLGVPTGGADAGDELKSIRKTNEEGNVLQRSLFRLFAVFAVKIFAIAKILEVIQPVIEVIGAILKTLGLLLIPLVQLLLALLTPILRFLANFITDFIQDPFGALLRGIRDIFTQLIPDLVTALAGQFQQMINTLFPSFANQAPSERGIFGTGALDLPALNFPFLGEGGGFLGNLFGSIFGGISDLFSGGNNGPSTTTNIIQVQGLTNEATASEINRQLQQSPSNFSPVGR